MASVAVAQNGNHDYYYHHHKHVSNEMMINCRSTSHRRSVHPKPNRKRSNPNPNPKDSSFNELWAGPAYSTCSPPPSSLPIPKFSRLNKPTTATASAPVALALPTAAPLNFDMDSLATQNLRRILNLAALAN